MLQMLNDEQVLDEAFRKRIIDQINGPENKQRKKLDAGKWEIWRDMIRPFVLERLKAQGFQDTTLKVMNQRAANINIFKKVVSKKARSYSKGVDRSVPGEAGAGGTVNQATKDIDVVATAMDLTGAMKKADRYRKAAKNCLVYIYPCLVEDPENPDSQVYTLTTKVFFPHLYDAIPDAHDREKPRCIILSPFTEESTEAAMPGLNGGDGRGIMTYTNPAWQRDHRDQTIANAPRDANAEKREYIFWTAKYHLTCDENGKAIPEKSGSPVELDGKTVGFSNPIRRLPFVAMAEEQDGEFWALGGDDLVEATILINLKLTDMESILHMQGWGQLVITGQDLAKKDFALGPQQALMLSSDKSAVHKTEALILQHDPHTEEHLKSVEVHVALCLTTNNLSVKSVATNLEASSVASAIAKMVDESENMDDISEDQEYYGKREKDAMRIAEAWLAKLRAVPNCLKELKGTKPLKVNEMVVQYHNQEQVVSEQERLANLKLRKDLGLDTIVDLIKRDNPGMTEEQAMKKALQIQNEQAELSAQAKAEAEKNGAPADEGEAAAADSAEPVDEDEEEDDPAPSGAQ